MSLPLADIAKNLLLVLFLFGSSLSLADEQVQVDVRIEHREVVGDQVLRLTQDQEVVIVWTTDEAAELHIHGYDIRIDISPNAPVETAFKAHATGRFAVTSHGFGGDHGHGHETLVYIEVYPK